MVNIVDGRKAYQGVEFVDGKPQSQGWKVGASLSQRAHEVVMGSDRHIYVRLRLGEQPLCDGICPSDSTASMEACMREYPLCRFKPVAVDAVP